MNRQSDGGPAFARPVSIDTNNGTLPDGDCVVDAQEGMSLRDYLAAKAMAAIIAHPGMEPDDSHREGVAQLAYEFADAMLKVRQQ